MPSASRALILTAALAVLACSGARAATEQPTAQTTPTTQATQATEAASAAQAVPAAQAHDSSSATETLQEVTVTAQRAKLAKRVTAFVDKITGPSFDGGVPRWGKPVCLLVSGLRREAVEFIRSRVDDVARASGIPLAAEGCHPDLYVLVSRQPQQLLRAMDSHHRWFYFGNNAHWGVVREFISTPGPVRVLYRDANDAPPGEVPAYPIVHSAKAGPITESEDNWNYDSHAGGYSVRWYVFRAFVIIDGSQLKGVTLGQFADYVAIVGLAQVRPSDGLADAPTILKLFDGSSQAAPARMTDWDRAFLKSIYATNPGSHGQRWHVVQDMMSEIAR